MVSLQACLLKLLITVFKSETIKLLSSKIEINDYTRITYIALFKRFDLLEMLYKATGAFLDVKSIFDQYSNHGKLDSLKYLTEIGAKCSTNAMDSAARDGHIEVVQWLHENRSEGCTTYAMDLAASNGHLEVVKWLHENRFEGCLTEAIDYAALFGSEQHHLNLKCIVHFQI